MLESNLSFCSYIIFVLRNKNPENNKKKVAY